MQYRAISQAFSVFYQEVIMKYLQVILTMIFLLLLLNFVGKIWKPIAQASAPLDVNISRVYGSSYRALMVEIVD
jgi:hypothetical protein